MSHAPQKDPVAPLIPFTGFYALEKRPGAFVSIDADMVYIYTPPASGSGDGIVTISNVATVSICIDGTTIDKFAFAPPYCSFEGRHLAVTDGKGKTIASLWLFRDHANGNSSALVGTIGGHAVVGTTPFSPIRLPVFAGEYYDKPTPGAPPPKPHFEIRADYSLYYRFDGKTDLERVPAYVYNYAMFVIQFPPVNPLVTLEMGTTPQYGLVAGNMAGGGLLVTILKENSYPPGT
jgi:hypothetical protein